MSSAADLANVPIHATSVVHAGRGLLIRGASGSGKSQLALELIARGATLVSDDQTLVEKRENTLWMSAPASIRGLIEARGIGILRARCTEAMLCAVLDLNLTETERLPVPRYTLVNGCEVPLLHKVETPYFASALLQYLAGGIEETDVVQ